MNNKRVGAGSFESTVVARITQGEAHRERTEPKIASPFNLGQSFASYQALAGIVSFWPCSALRDNVIRDFTGYGKHLTTVPTGLSLAVYNNLVGYLPLATGQYLTRATEAAFQPTTTSFYCGGWFRLTALTAEVPLITKYDYSVTPQRSFALHINPAGKLRLLLSNDGTTVYTVSHVADNEVVPVGEWFFAAGRFRYGQDFSVFLNRHLETSLTPPAALFSSTAPLQVGALNNGAITHQGLDVANLFFGSGVNLPDRAFEHLQWVTRPLWQVPAA